MLSEFSYLISSGHLLLPFCPPSAQLPPLSLPSNNCLISASCANIHAHEQRLHIINFPFLYRKLNFKYSFETQMLKYILVTESFFPILNNKVLLYQLFHNARIISVIFIAKHYHFSNSILLCILSSRVMIILKCQDLNRHSIFCSFQYVWNVYKDVIWNVYKGL